MYAVKDGCSGLVLRPHARSIIPLAVVTTATAVLLAVLLFVGPATGSPLLAALAVVAFLVMPAIVLFGTMVEVRGDSVAVRHGIGRRHITHRDDVVRVVAGRALRQPSIECRSGRMRLRSVWTPDQLQRLASYLGAEFVR
jgi:hypothetical protein